MAGHFHGPIQTNQNGYVVPQPGATVFIFQPGTTTQVSLFVDSGLVTPLAQPLVADSSSLIDFYLASPQFVDMQVSGNHISTTTVRNVWIEGPDNPITTIPPGTITTTMMAPGAADGAALGSDVITTANANAHTHTESQVAGLTTDLANRSNVGHTHAVQKIYRATLYNAGGIPVDVYDLGVVEKAATLSNIRLKCRNGTSMQFNVRKNGATALLSADQVITAAATWTNITALPPLQNNALAAGDYLELLVNANTGTVTQAGAQVVMTEND